MSVTLDPILFNLSDLATGGRLGFGLVCVDQRYASVLWRGEARLDRRFADPQQWNDIAHQIAVGLEPRPLMHASALVQLLVGERTAVVVQWLSREPLTIGKPELAAQWLDTVLNQQVDEP
jgi:hypothetical protein